MKIRKAKKLMTVVLLGVTLFAVGCAASSTPSQPSPTSKPSITPPSTSQAKPSPTPSPSSSTKPSSTPTSTPSVTPKATSWSTPPPMQIDQNKQYTATIQTEKGNMIIQLFAKDVPITVNNFVFLAHQGYYDSCTFHRVIPGFMAQGGDPTGTGGGGPGYKFNNEITSHKHVAGAISMANAGANTNGSQFFICYVDQPSLDGGYSVFGQLVQGMDILKKLTPRDPTKNPTFTGDKIITITIEEK